MVKKIDDFNEEIEKEMRDATLEFSKYKQLDDFIVPSAMFRLSIYDTEGDLVDESEYYGQVTILATMKFESYKRLEKFLFVLTKYQHFHSFKNVLQVALKNISSSDCTESISNAREQYIKAENSYCLALTIKAQEYFVKLEQIFANANKKLSPLKIAKTIKKFRGQFNRCATEICSIPENKLITEIEKILYSAKMELS